MNEALNKQRVHAARDRISAVMRTVELQNDLINFTPGTKDISKDEILSRYHYLYKALGNIFELNQILVDDLDDVASLLYEISDELQDMQKAE